MITVQSRSVLARARVFAAARRALLSLLPLVLTGWLAFTWFQTVQRTIRYYTPLPTWDYWRTAGFLPLYRAFDLGVLWRQHVDHRIVFPEIVFAADYLLFHGRQLLPLSISFLLYVGNWLVLAWVFWSEDSLGPLVRKMGILVAGIVIGWQGSAVVLADSFLLQWTLLQFAVLLSLALLVRFKETSSTTYLLATIVCAVFATYSSVNGMLLWPILLVAALFLSIGKHQIFLIAIAGLVSVGVYFIGYNFTGNLSIGNLFRYPLYSLEFLGAYLSMPFGVIKSTEFGVRLGLATVVSVILFTILALRKDLLASRSGVVFFGWYLFSLLSAVLICAGRMDATDPLFMHAKPARYLTGPLVTWAVFVLLCLWLSSRLHWRFTPPYALVFVVAALLLIGLPKLRWWLQGADEARAKEQLAALAIELGVQDNNVNLNVYPDPQSQKVWTKTLRENHLSVFYAGKARWLGVATSSFARVRDSFVPGEITYTFPVMNGVEVAGWVDESGLRLGTGWVLLVNETGEIVGFGRKLPAGFPGIFYSPHTPPSLGWAGFVNLTYSTKYFSAYAAGKQGLFPIHGSVAVPTASVVSWQPAASQIRGVEWRMEPSWTVNHLPPNGFFGQPPSGPILGSWSGDDRNTGRIASTVFAAPADNCLILPVLQGPSAGGLSAEVVDADTDQILASVPFQDSAYYHRWAFWRLPFTGPVKHLRIVAQDIGKDWGEWLAIGNPSQCK